MESLFDYLDHYDSLGYDVTFTNIYYKSGIRMVKRYSRKTESSVTCEQIIDRQSLRSMDRLHEVLDFMYNDIQDQEESGDLYKKVEKTFTEDEMKSCYTAGEIMGVWSVDKSNNNIKIPPNFKQYLKSIS